MTFPIGPNCGSSVNFSGNGCGGANISNSINGNNNVINNHIHLSKGGSGCQNNNACGGGFGLNIGAGGGNCVNIGMPQCGNCVSQNAGCQSACPNCGACQCGQDPNMMGQDPSMMGQDPYMQQQQDQELMYLVSMLAQMSNQGGYDQGYGY